MWCIKRGGNVIAVLPNLGHTGSQPEMKVGAVDPASTNRGFTNWRSKMHGKTQLGQSTINFHH